MGTTDRVPRSLGHVRGLHEIRKQHGYLARNSTLWDTQFDEVGVNDFCKKDVKKEAPPLPKFVYRSSSP